MTQLMRGVAVYCLTDNQMRAFSQFSEDTMDENSAGSEESQVQAEERRPSLLARFFKSGDLPYPRRIAYGIGHVFNDLCASMWFTYFLLFYHLVLRIDNSDAGLLVLIGQIADALTTPVIGHFCDNTSNRYGGRKTWHLIGTGMVACSLFFFWHECIYCSMQPMKYQILYFSCFIIVFQAGWATVQVSHLSLIPVLTSDKSIRVELNSIRYAFTILSNSGVFIVVLVLLSSVNKSSQITPNDQWLFSGTALGIIVVGLSFVFMFHIGTKEPSNGGHGSAAGDQPTNNRLPWYRWFLNPKFYLVALIYMSSRLIVNLTQVYSPLYMIDTLKMYRSSVAIIPLVIYFSGLIATFFMKRLNEFVGRYVSVNDYYLGFSL
ncbi:PREDICTED: major facilitator superfamily domain-containing protein 12-like [Amphimedon queenslandica]|uniref:Uncharacterized protein n=2 Tax=Amphimedon queenslandica TaxID=400682 RepID=A0AAN0J6F1_AMPQE|nr:PREDICTED: major facilitator superfamily domain-containing protein 12-like [Amphimedon queenslandica]|eukprot:XP_019852296.1 PREDICTED: major facilitator superfamily domain-containing protein 12-like [Amphimedon queenslandica]